MGDTTTTPQSPKATSQPLHPVYSVTNIQQKVRILDGVKVSYTSWVRLFQLHARGYRVIDHIDGTKLPADTDSSYASWLEIDSIVLQWIYGTLSDDLLARVLTGESTAHQAWVRIQNIFHNNKGAHIAALEHEFVNMTLKSQSSLEVYFQRLRELADQLNDLLDTPVSDKRLVLQMVRSLPSEYDTMGSIINQSLPPWEEACEILLNDQKRRAARDLLSGSPSIAAAAQTNTNPPPATVAPPARENSRDIRPRSTQARNRGRGRNSGQRNTNNYTGSPYYYRPSSNMHYPYWAPPPY
ncbi:uncharacterized protein LOC110931396 [Helianthus annuus]|uniref:uncharacterized protein LOC110931396 n=1 Tax=Helianthus annuus TaxID=4232 RepID=UPI000B8F13D2|nr:uncharacterized protein LOC110931396 [Helianthus annuus]